MAGDAPKKMDARAVSKKLRLSQEAQKKKDGEDKKKEEEEEKKASCLLNFVTSVLSFGLWPLLKWVWTSEDAYAKGDPRGWLNNRHTERFKKVALLLGGVCAFGESISLSLTTPKVFYCIKRCPEESSLAYVDPDAPELGAIASSFESTVCFPRPTPLALPPPPLLASPPPSSPPPLSPATVEAEELSQASGMLRYEFVKMAIAINESTVVETDNDWFCVDAEANLMDTVTDQVNTFDTQDAAAYNYTLTGDDLVSSEQAQAEMNNFLEDAPFPVGSVLNILTTVNVRFLIAGLMVATVAMWFVLRAALFNVIKGNKLCNCFQKCCPCLTKCMKTFFKKFLGGLCPIALNVIMVLNNGLALNTVKSLYSVNMSTLDIVLLVVSIIVFLLCVLFAIIGIFLALVPMLCAACAKACGSKSCSPLGIISNMLFSVITMSLIFFSFVGII